jgi:hypothetical protein
MLLRLQVQNMPGCHLRKYGWGKWADWRKQLQQQFCTDCIHFLCLVFSPNTHQCTSSVLSIVGVQMDESQLQVTPWLSFIFFPLLLAAPNPCDLSTHPPTDLQFHTTLPLTHSPFCWIQSAIMRKCLLQSGKPCAASSC